MKNYRFQLILGCIIILIPMFVGLAMYSRLPDQIPIHYSFNGEVDGYASKNFAIFGTPLIMMAVEVFSLFVTLNDPKRKNISDKAINLVIWIVPLVSIVMFFLTTARTMGIELNVNRVVLLMLGVLFIATGNYLPKSRKNYTVGIKVPWTLNDDEIWNKTHRMGGRLFMGVGVLSIVLSFINRSDLLILFEILLIASALIPIVYSYLLYRQKEKDKE